MRLNIPKDQAKYNRTAFHFKCNGLKRWKIQTRWGSIRLHHWVEGDPPQYQHAHPWNFLTIVLRGGYDDIGEGREPDLVRAPSIRYRDLNWRHAVVNVKPHTWSIVITGPLVRDWLFWIRGERVDEATWNAREC